ncbi:MAG: YDG domain-containing protein, partial [Oribacterium sp.]|nr:YDG domain-containing protein [Oribacterium sp.]
YVYRAVLPEELGKFEVADTADLPEIDVMVGDASVALLADAPYDLNNNDLVIDYQKEVLKNTALYELEYAESKSAASWKKIPAAGEAPLTEILDKQPESATEITLHVRKAAAGSAAAGEAAEIKIPVRPAKLDPIQGTDVTKDSYSIMVKRQPVSGYEYGISESADGKLQWQTEKTFTSPKPANTYYITRRVKATDSSFASKPADRLEVTTPDALLIDGPASKVSFETKGTYGQTLNQIPVQLAEGFQVVNYSKSPVSGTWKFSAYQSGTPASSIYPEVEGTTAYQVEFIPTETSEGQYGKPLTQSVIPEVSPKELRAVITTPIEKDYDGSTDIALEATVEIGASGQSYTIRGLKGSFADANAGTDKTVTIDSSKATVETGENPVNLQNYLITYPAQTGTIHRIQGLVSIDPQAWTGEKTYGDASFSLTGVKKVGDGALTYTSSDEKVLTVDAQGQVTIKGTGSAVVSITMAKGTNYLGTSTPAKGRITIEKGTLTLALTVVNRSTGVQQPEGILGTYEDDFDIIARIQGAYGDKLQGMIHFYDNENQNPNTIPVGEAGTAVLKLPKPGVASVGTHRMTAEFDFDTHQEWAAKYNTPAPAAYTFAIGKVAAPQITWPTAASVKAGSPLSDSALSGGSTECGSFAWKNPTQTAQAGTHSYEVVFTPNEWASARYEIAAMIGTAEVTATEDKPEKPNRNSSSSGQNKTFGSGVIRQDSVKGTIDSTAGIITGETNSFANDGKSHWMLDEHGWWLRFADNTYPKGSVRESGGISHSWELINGNWWAFDETGYAKTGWLRDEDYGGWFYMDLEHGMRTGWVLLNGAWYYFNPVSDGKRGMMYAGQRTPDGYYVEKNGVWDGRNKQ